MRYGWQDWKLSLYHWLGIKKWCVVLHECDGNVHVLPIADDMVHEFHDCICGPKWEPGLYVHNSLDGREKREKSSHSS